MELYKILTPQKVQKFEGEVFLINGINYIKIGTSLKHAEQQGWKPLIKAQTKKATDKVSYIDNGGFIQEVCTEQEKQSQVFKKMSLYDEIKAASIPNKKERK